MTATKKAPTLTSERRVAIRRQPTMGTVLRLPSPPRESPGVGLVWNISTSGVSLLLNEPIQPGTLLTGELATLDDATILPVRLRVMHLAKLRTGDYCVGGQFDRELRAEEMQPYIVGSASKV